MCIRDREYTIDEMGLSIRCNAGNVRFDSSAFTLSNIVMLPYAGAGNVDGQSATAVMGTSYGDVVDAASYFFVYKIDLDPSKTPSTLTLPAGTDIKLAAVQMVKSEGLAGVYAPKEAGLAEVENLLRVAKSMDTSTNSVPVSYTHLDVYKRQAQGKSIHSANT